MTRQRFPAGVLALLSLGAIASARPHGVDFAVDEGLEVTLWAESPQLYNPTAMDVDARGRVWVTEAVNYRKWDGRNPGREHAAGDRVLILEDTDGDGVCDSTVVFAQDADLVSPLGISVIGDRVVVSCSPNVFVYRDEDGDDRADSREVFLTGFGGFDHDHGVHSFFAGPDGRWYGNTGNAGPHVVTDRAGWTLRSGSFYNGGGPETADNKPGLVSDDGRAWTGGLVLAVEPDGTGLEVLAHNFRNNYELALDSFGNMFQSDNDDDGNQGCRTLFVLEGGDHGFFSADGTRSWQADRRPGQSTQTAHWHQDDPGVVPAGSINGAGAPTGVAMYEGELLARWIGGAVLNCDAGRGVVYAHFPRAAGAGYELERTSWLEPAASAEGLGAQWFRPSDVVVGPDGAVYVSDWFDPGVGGHAAGDREAYGRILRVAPKDTPPRAPALELGTTAGALAALRSPALSVRAFAWSALSARGADIAPELERAAARGEPRQRARALWLLGPLGANGRAALERTLADPDPDLRITAFRALRRFGHDLAGARARLVRDESPAVRREVALSLRGVPLDECGELLVALAVDWDGTDRTYLEALGLAAQGREAWLYTQLATEIGAVPTRWSERFAGLAWRLHPEGAVPALAARARTATLSEPMRRQAIDALAFVPSRAAGEAMATLAVGGPDDLRDYARWWVEHRSTNDWRDFGLRDDLASAGLERAELVFSSDVVRAGTIAIDVDVRGARTLWLVVEDGDDGNACDWAAWIEPRLVGAQGAVALTRSDWIEASAAWGDVRVDRDCVGGALSVGGEAVRGLGTHAHSRIAFALLEGVERFVCRAGPEDSGTGQNDGQTTSVRFRVFVERPVDRSHLDAARVVALDPEADRSARRAAVETLAADAEGGLMLVHLAQQGALDEEVKTLAAEGIFSNPDVAVRALASEHFGKRGHWSDAFPPIAELAQLAGDPVRGQSVFFDRRALCSTCHTVTRDGVSRGGDVGPDLTSIRRSYAKDALFDAILNPNAGIAFGYDTWTIEDTGGRLYSGFLLADGEDLVLKDTRGKRHVIAAEEVAGRYKQRLSTMPEGVALGIDAQELADLVAFLLVDPEAEPVFGPEQSLFNGVDLSGWTAHLTDPTARPEQVWSVADGVLTCEGDPIGYLRTVADYTNFELELEWRFDPERGAGNSGVLLRMTGEDKVWPKSIEAQLQHRNAGDIWNIDAVDMETDPRRTTGRRTARLQPSSERPLGEWNHYRIRLHHGRLSLTVNDVLQNRAAWCDEVAGKICLQSEGAPIQFRDIRLREIVD